MKDIWVLSVKTSLPDTCYSSADIETAFFALDSFEKGRDTFRKMIHDFAFSKNSMFDGEGNIIYLKKYLDDAWEPDEDDDVVEDFLTKSKLEEIYYSIKAIFEGKDCDVSGFDQKYFDGMIAIDFQNGIMSICGEDDGPINGYLPDIATNAFSMKEEKDYYLYVDDCFGQDDFTSELYIDLKKVVIS